VSGVPDDLHGRLVNFFQISGVNTWSVGRPPRLALLDEHQTPAVEAARFSRAWRRAPSAPGLAQKLEEFEDLQFFAHVQRRRGLVQEQNFRSGPGPGPSPPVGIPPGDFDDWPFLEVRRGGPAHGLEAQTRSESVKVPRRRRCGYRPMSTISGRKRETARRWTGAPPP